MQEDEKNVITINTLSQTVLRGNLKNGSKDVSKYMEESDYTTL